MAWGTKRSRPEPFISESSFKPGREGGPGGGKTAGGSKSAYQLWAAARQPIVLIQRRASRYKLLSRCTFKIRWSVQLVLAVSALGQHNVTALDKTLTIQLWSALLTANGAILTPGWTTGRVPTVAPESRDREHFPPPAANINQSPLTRHLASQWDESQEPTWKAARGGQSDCVPQSIPYFAKFAQNQYEMLRCDPEYQRTRQAPVTALVWSMSVRQV